MLSFWTAYKVVQYVGEEASFPRICAGIRSHTVMLPEPFEEVASRVFEFVVNSGEDVPVRYFFGGTPKKVGDTVEVEDALATMRGDEPTHWRFEELTLDVFDGMKTNVSGFDKVRAELHSDEDLQTLYRTDLLDDWWTQDAVPGQIVEAKGVPNKDGDETQRSDGRWWKRIKAGVWRRLPKDHQPAAASVPTPPELGDIYGDHGYTDLDAGPDPWKESEGLLPEGASDTVDAHINEGKWTPERRKLHKKIVDEVWAGIPEPLVPKKPSVVLVMGLPGIGKSTMVRKTTLAGTEAAHIDADKIKEHLPEYGQALEQGASDAAEIVHRESSHVADRCINEGMDSGRSFVLEGTGASPKFYDKLVNDLQNEGYLVSAVLLHTDDVEFAVERARIRGRRDGRKVREGFIREAHPQIMETFGRIAGKLDSFQVYKAEKGKETELVWNFSKLGGEEVKDKETVDKLRREEGLWYLNSPLSEQDLDDDGHIPWSELQRRFKRFVELEDERERQLLTQPPRFRDDQGVEFRPHPLSDDWVPRADRDK